MRPDDGRKQQPRRSRLGQGLVEMALVLPVILLLLIGIFDFSYYFFCAISVNSAARLAVRRAAMNNLTKDQVKQLVLDGAIGVAVPTNNVSVTTKTADTSRPGNPPTVNVNVDYQHRFFGLGWVNINQLRIRSSFTSTVVTDPAHPTLGF